MDQMKAISIVALFCFSFALLPAFAAVSEDHPDFSGNWRLNTFISDDPFEKMQQATVEMMRSKRIASMDSPRLGRGGLGRGGEIRRGMGQKPDDEEMEIRFRNLDLSADALEITHEDPLLIIRYPDGRERSIYTDGREEKKEYGYGPVEISARWKKNGKLVVKSETEQGRTTTEKYELAMEGRQLQVEMHVEGDGPAPSFQFTRFYDRAPSDDTATGN